MKYKLTFLLSLTIQVLIAQQTPFNRGVNLTGWFQVGSAQQIQFTKYSKTDFENIQSLGCDVIRLPINLHFMTDGAPDYNLDPLFLSFLDGAVSWAEELGLHLILDNHTFDPAANTDPAVGEVLEKVWLQLANHYKNAYEHIYYEVLNEPHGIGDALWNTIQQDVVDVIRTVDQTHTIIVGGAGWNSYNNLDDMPVYNDDNLIYTFHFYDPFVFTHQGATWVEPSMAPLAGIPFPYNASEMPGLPSALEDTWVGSAYNSYNQGGTISSVRELIDIAVQFRDQRNVPVFCGEFGVFIPNSNSEDRVLWYEEVRSYLEQHNISWTSWDYHGGFGLYEPDGTDLFDHDLNTSLLEALGFNVPPQTPFVIQPDSLGFFMYSDYIGEKMVEASYGSGSINYYSTQQPNNENYCLQWKNAAQYDAIAFDFKPDKDMTYLVDHGFALDFLVRGDDQQLSFDMRFVDTKTDVPEDHPWRIRVTIDNTDVSWNSHWHHLHIPLTMLVEHGSWDNNQWYNPQGDFDWSAIDRFEIVAEQGTLQGTKLWFDNIQVTDLDTAMIYENDVVTSITNPKFAALDIHVFPNPAQDHLKVQTENWDLFELELLDFSGKVLHQMAFEKDLEMDLSNLPDGIYLLKIMKNGALVKAEKILIYKRP